MNSYGTARLAAKCEPAALITTAIADPLQSPGLTCGEPPGPNENDPESHPRLVRVGELCYLAVLADEPAGRPIRSCGKVEVRLDLVAPEDYTVLEEHGLARMRQTRIRRLARQARRQGALLTVEDLAYLMCSSPATVKRDLALLRRRGEAAPTRGSVLGIGPLPRT